MYLYQLFWSAGDFVIVNASTQKTRLDSHYFYLTSRATNATDMQRG